MEQNKAQYNLDRQTAKPISNRWKNFTRTELLEKAATVKRFEYSPLDSELKKQTEITKKECPVLDKVYEFCKKDDEMIITKI